MPGYTLSYLLGRLQGAWARLRLLVTPSVPGSIAERYTARINYEPGKPPYRYMTQAERFKTVNEATGWIESKIEMLSSDGYTVNSVYIHDTKTGTLVHR